MARRENTLARLLKENGGIVHFPAVIEKSIFYSSSFHDTIFDVYRKLGGVLNEYPVNFGNFDIILDNCYIELDEENHFNRYRKITLLTDIYHNNHFLPLDDYILYCDTMENKVGKVGNFWTSPKSEEQFGKSSPEKDLSGNGPARWKQRAFYDFLKDVYCLLQDKPIYRISVHETIENLTIDKLLKKEINSNLVMNFIENRVNLKLT